MVNRYENAHERAQYGDAVHDTDERSGLTVDVLFGLYFRHLLVTLPLVLTPHLAIVLDAFVAPLARSDEFVQKFLPDSAGGWAMYEMTPRGDFSFLHYIKGNAVDAGQTPIPYRRETFFSLIWQALFTITVLVMGRKVYHNDAHPPNLMGIVLAPSSPYYNKPWVYVLPPADDPDGEPRLYVLSPHMHQNLFCLVIDFDTAIIAGPHYLTTHREQRDLRWNLQKVLYGHTRTQDPFYHPLNLADHPVRFFPVHQNVYLTHGPLTFADEAQILTRDTWRLSDPTFDVELNWPSLESARLAITTVPDVETLRAQFPDAVVVGSLTSYAYWTRVPPRPAPEAEPEPVTPPAPDSPVVSPDDIEETPQLQRGRRRARSGEPGEDDDEPEPKAKRPRFRACVVCGRDSEKPGIRCTRFCAALKAGDLRAVRVMSPSSDTLDE